MSVDVIANGKTDLLDRQLKAIADPARRRILELLKRTGGCSCEDVPACDPGKCVCDLEPELKLTQPTITHHIQVLRDAGLVETRKIGRWLYCCREENALKQLAAWLNEV